MKRSEDTKETSYRNMKTDRIPNCLNILQRDLQTQRKGWGKLKISTQRAK